MADTEFKVNERSAAVAKMAKDYDWDLLAALVGGTRAMRNCGKMFLPQWPKEEDASYNARLTQSVLFNGFGHTTEVLSAKPFSRPMTFSELAPSVDPLRENIDAMGTDIQSFSSQIMLASLRVGLHGVLVEVPEAKGVKTKADEKRAGIRPYFTHFPNTSILGWRAKHDANGSYLTQLRLYEEAEEDNGAWGTNYVPQVRVLTPGKWEIWREARDKRSGQIEWKRVQKGSTSIQKIPFVFFYGIKEGFGIGKPPLLDLAFLNLKHWQSSSDQDNILHVARVPILFAKGFTQGEDSLSVGSNSVASSMSPESELTYVEHTGAAIDAGRTSLQDLEDQMRQIGAELLVARPSVNTAKQIDSEDETNRSVLQKIAEDFEDSLEQCLKFAGEWIKEESTPEVKVNKNFKSAALGEKTGDFLLRAADSGHVSRQTTFEQMQAAEVISPEISWEEEQKRIMGESALRKQLAADGAVPKAAD